MTSIAIDRVEEGFKTEVIHVMFYNEVYVVALGPSVYLLINSRKSPGNLLCPKHTSHAELPPLQNHMPPDSRYQLETKKI